MITIMRTIDENGNEITNPDLSKGRIVIESILICHHPEILPVEEVWHYEIAATYPNGGEDVERVVDVEGSSGVPAWDEYEEVERYILYTKEELDQIAEAEKNSLPNRIKDLEDALHMILTGVTS